MSNDNEQLVEDGLGAEPSLGAEPIGSLTGDEIVSLPATATVLEAAQKISDAAVSLLVLGSAENVECVVSERDIVRAVAEGVALDETPAADYGSTTLRWAMPESAISDVIDEMMSGYVRHVLVAGKDGKMIGIVSMRDILAAYSSMI